MKPNKLGWPLIIILVVVGMCLVCCLALGAVAAFAPEYYSTMLDDSSLKVGTSAPDFELTTLTGDVVRLSDFKGRPVLLTFGATWCPDCRKEAPLLNQLHEEKPELVILLVDSKEGAGIVQEYAEQMGITHPILLDPHGEVMELYQVFAIPTELFIDEDGVVQAKIIESITEERLSEMLPLIGVMP